MPANVENSAVATGLEKVNFHSNPKERAMPKNAQITQLLSISWRSVILMYFTIKSILVAVSLVVFEVVLDSTVQLQFCFSLSCTGDENGNPLQCSCLENPRDGGLLSMGSHRVGHDWSDLAAAAAHASKVMLKILQARSQQYVICELPSRCSSWF